MDLILASTSTYRRALLKRLGLSFSCQPPATDETRLPGEAPETMASRLSLLKARAVARQFPDALVIGSDQVAVLGDRVLGKPGNHETAFDQLKRCSGRAVQFYTGVAVVCAGRGFERQQVEPYAVHFRTLSDEKIDSYLRREQPYDCAGSFKCEGLGIALFKQLEGNDPTSLEGLPLIALTSLLKDAGIEVI